MKKFVFLTALMAVFCIGQTFAAEDREGSSSDNEYDIYDRNRDSADFNPDDYPDDSAKTYYQNYNEYPPGPGQPPEQRRTQRQQQTQWQQQNQQQQTQQQQQRSKQQKQIAGDEYNLYDRNRDRKDFNQYDYPRSSDYYYPQ